jgi:hypothetical protein
MPTILNCLDKEQTTVLGGNHYHFKAGQMKYFHDKGIASAIARLKAEDGFVMLPEEFDDVSMIKDESKRELVITPQMKDVMSESKKEGVNNYCQNLRKLIYNATVSLQKDIDRAGYKYDARVEATKADLQRLKELAHYQSTDLDQDQKMVDEFKTLEKKVAKTSK